MIEQLVSQVAAKLGIEDTIAQRAVGTVLGLMHKKGDDGAINALFDKIPGAADLAGQYGNKETSSFGSMGSIMGTLGSLVGGNSGDAMEAMSALKSTGLSMDQAKDMAPVITGFMKEHAGDDLLNNAVHSVPGLKGLLG